MTGRTHDLAALTTLTAVVATQPLATISVGTLFVAVAANLIGAVAPDLDQPTGELWRKVPAGTIFGHILHPFFGAHRSISHSLLGLAIFGIVSKLLLQYMHNFLLVDMGIVWLAFMLGVISHLGMDTLTKDGVPWLFPIPFKFGFPPIKSWRVATGKLAEKALVFPLLLLVNAFLIYSNYEKFWNFLKYFIQR